MYYFISDLHLGIADKETETYKQDLFVKLLKRIEIDAKTLFILGDLFDYWFDYKRVIPKEFFRVLASLYDFRAKGIPVIYLMGNHDFGHNGFFEEELNIEVIKDDIDIEIEGKKFFLSHGDGKTYYDKPYLFLRSILRNPISQWLYRKLHPDFAINLASSSSKKSRDHTSKKYYGEIEGMDDFAKNKIESGFDYVVMGHRHIAKIINYDKGIYINIGDWIKKPTMVVFDGNNIKLLNVEDFLNS